MENQTQVKDVTDTNEEKPKTRRPRGDGDFEAAALKIALPVELAARVRSVIQELKSRGATVGAEEIMSAWLITLPSRYFDDVVTQMTPEDYYLEAARKIPELREKLIQQAKKALTLSIRGKCGPRKAKPPKNEGGQSEGSPIV